MEIEGKGFYSLVAPTAEAGQVHPRLRAFMDVLAEDCPPLEDALRLGHVMYSGYHAGDFRDMAAVFGALVDTAEEVRQRRRTVGDTACAVMAVHGPDSEHAAHWLMDLPHWLAVRLYGPVGLTFAMAAIEDDSDVDEDDDYDVIVPPVPVSFFAVRPLTADDLELLRDEGAAQQLGLTCEDDGRDVVGDVIGEPGTGAAARARFHRLLRAYAIPHQSRELRMGPAGGGLRLG